MPKATDVRLLGVSSETEKFAYRTPMKFGGRVVTEVVLLNVRVEVETGDGRRGVGLGSMPMGNVWAWPSRQVPGDAALAAMIQLGRRVARDAGRYSGSGHPLEITRDLAAAYQAAADEITSVAGLVEPMPRLAQLVAASPTEAAIHDGYGKALGQNSYNLLSAEFVGSDLSAYLTAEFAGEYLDRYTLRKPKASMPLYHLIGALDPLTDADLDTRLDDGLPVTLPEWIQADGLTHLKIKLGGDDLGWDVDRVVSIERVAAEAQRQRGYMSWYYSADFNERCANVDYLLDFLDQVGRRSPEALRRLQYIEQPTHRDLRASPAHRHLIHQ